MPVLHAPAAAPRPASGVPSLSRPRATSALGLTYWEFDAAVHLGLLPTVPGDRPWQRRVPRRDVDRLRGDPGFPGSLRARVRLVNASEGAQLLRISSARFARLARGGLFSPLSFYPNRHGVLVWRYPAAELLSVARMRPELLTGPLPPGLRQALRRGEDWRPRRWRGRRTGQLIRHARGPWEKAAVPAAVLTPATVRAAVPDLRERKALRALRPPLTGDVPLRPPLEDWPPPVREVTRATDPDESRWYESLLLLAVREARRSGPPPVASQRADVGDPDDGPSRRG